MDEYFKRRLEGLEVRLEQKSVDMLRVLRDAPRDLVGTDVQAIADTAEEAIIAEVEHIWESERVLAKAIQSLDSSKAIRSNSLGVLVANILSGYHAHASTKVTNSGILGADYAKLLDIANHYDSMSIIVQYQNIFFNAKDNIWPVLGIGIEDIVHIHAHDYSPTGSQVHAQGAVDNINRYIGIVVEPKEHSHYIATRLPILNRFGLHARPASAFTKAANLYPGDVIVYHGDEKARGRSIMELMMLSVPHGEVLDVLFEPSNNGKKWDHVPVYRAMEAIIEAYRIEEAIKKDDPRKKRLF